MKTKILILVLLVIFFPLMSAAQQYVPTENEEVYGTWVNTEYSGDYTEEQKIRTRLEILMTEDVSELIGIEKVIFYPGGKCQLFPTTLTTAPIGEVEYAIASKWTDSDGSILYKQAWVHYFEYHGKFEKDRNFTTIKVNASKQTIEFVFDDADYPTEVDPEHSKYRIYYRQK